MHHDHHFYGKLNLLNVIIVEVKLKFGTKNQCISVFSANISQDSLQICMGTPNFFL